MSSPVGAPRPRVIALNLSGEEVEVLRSLAGSVVAADDLKGLHPEEHDVLVLTDAHYAGLDNSYPRRLAFGPHPRPTDAGLSASSRGGHRPFTRMMTQNRPARDFQITSEAKQLGLESLVRRSCLPEPGSTYTGFYTPVYPEHDAVPFAREVLESPLTLAALLELRVAGDLTDSILWLPEIARSAFREWVLFAFERWRQDAPDVFPESAAWKTSDRWASPNEIEQRRALSEFDAAEAERRVSVAAQREEMVGALDTAQADGEQWRSLLTETGDELVSAVADALRMMQFEVIDADSLPQHKGAKREDLRVRDGNWTALVEVKGYGGAAKSNDLSQVTRAAMLYGITEQRAPDALWYIPNTEREVDPAQRALPLASRQDELTAFAGDYHGCLIDTRELFALRQQVATGAKTPAAARAELRNATERYEATSEN